MAADSKFGWVGFYQELADKLMQFAEDRAPLVEHIKNVYLKADIKLPKLEKDGNVHDIDPFTVFGLFNKGITNENRIRIAAGFAEELGIKAEVPNAFDGIPVLNNMKATFYYFDGDRQVHDIDNLWNVFVSALHYAVNQNPDTRLELIKAYDTVLPQKGVKWNLTMGLFWIRPEEYINLDSRNRLYLSRKDVSPCFANVLPYPFKGLDSEAVLSGSEYTKLCDDCRKIMSEEGSGIKTFPELSEAAWHATLKNEKNAVNAEIQEQLFRKWMMTQKTENGEPMSKGTVSHYTGPLKGVCQKIHLVEYPNLQNLFSVTDLVLFRKIREVIMTAPEYADVNKDSNRYLQTGLKLWFDRFLSWLASGGKESDLHSSENPDDPDEKKEVRYWLYAPGENANKWDEFYNKGIMAINWQEMGDLSLFSDREEMRTKMKEIYQSDGSFMHDSLCTWEFAHVMKPGDVVYAKKGLHDLVGRGIVASEYMFDESASEFGHIRKVNWTHEGEWKNAFRQVLKTLTEITGEKDYKKLEALFGEMETEEVDEKDPDLQSNDWKPALDEYSPGFSKDDWLNILGDKEIIGPVWRGVLAAFYGMGGAATCTQVGKKYNRSPYGISGMCSSLARSIYKKTNCPITKRKNGQNRCWPILFQGKKAGSDVEGAYIWKLRPELYDALTEFDIMKYEWEIEPSPQSETGIHYWWLNANPKIWSIAGMAVGEVQDYTLYNDNGNKRRIFQNFMDAKAGDIVIGYESTPVRQIVALAKVSTPQDGEKIWFEKTESLSVPIDSSALKECPELENMEFFQNPQGSLFKLTQDEYDIIMDLIREENPIQKKDSAEKYTEERFLQEVYMTADNYRKMRAVLEKKRNIILQGAPGVGKTYAAKRLAYSVIGEVDDDRIEFVQFHQNYSYEDFVMGYKPVENGFELKQGIFYRFCQKAASHPDKEYFFIIDEINRGNMSKIFGELLMLIEKDYRGEKAILAYNGLPFSVPEKLYIIGMMNTADRSLAMIDYALRRRFSFFDMEPGFDSEQFVKYQKGLNNKKLDELIVQVKILNQEITADKSLGKGFCIGHSYFCGQEECTNDWLYSVVNYDILPMLREYWFDDTSRVQKWEGILNGVLQ